MVSSLQLSWCFYYDWYLPCGLNNADNEDKDKQNTNQPLLLDIIQLMTFDEVNTRIDQPMEHDIHRGSRGLINPCIHRNGKSLTVLLYDIKSKE